MALPTITVTPTTVPKRSVCRRSSPNPFVDMVKGLTVDDRDSALFFELDNAITAKEPTPNGKATRYVDPDVREALRLLTDAGDDNNVTVRKKVEDTPAGVMITFWVVTRITRGTAPTE